MAEFEKETAQALRKGLPPEASIYNPVDVLGDALADRFDFALQTVLKIQMWTGFFCFSAL